MFSREDSEETSREVVKEKAEVHDSKASKTPAEERRPAKQTRATKKKENRNDAAAEQWARFYEQHGEEIASQHGYTKAHYEQYLRRGGTPGGDQSF